MAQLNISLLIHRTILVLIIGLVFSCKHNDPKPVAEEMIINTGMEEGDTGPNAWYHLNYPNNQLTDRTSWSTDQFSSSSHSLAISQPFMDNISYSFWGQRFEGTTPVGKNLTLTVKIKGVSIAGTGAFIALYGDGLTTPALQSAISDPITGTFDWTTYTIKLSTISSSVGLIRIHFFFQTNTTGTIYFDDASLKQD